ncbi:MAG: DUF998 domain-containing protein [Blastocatellia bacterium]
MKIDPTSWLAYACLSGNGCFAVAVLVLHLLQPDMSPLNAAVSYYVHGAQGWLFTVGLLAWGIGSAALFLGLARTIRIRAGNAGLLALAVWSAGVLTSGLFRADPWDQWNNSPSAAGLIHENAARVSFIALPIAALLISHGLRRAPEWRRTAGVLYLLAVMIIVSLMVFFASLLPISDSLSPPILFGLTERMLLAVYAAWLCAAAIGLLRSTTDPAALRRFE